MGAFEKNKMDTKFRETLLQTVLVYQDIAKVKKSDPLALRKMSPLGIPMTGKELGKILDMKAKDIDVGRRKAADNDSVFWVVMDPRTGKPAIDPKTGKPVQQVKITQDIGDWLKKLNKQLDDWGQDSAIKDLRKKRWITAGVIAAVVVAAVVITVVTLGTGTAAAAAAGTAATGSTAAGGTAAAVTTGTAVATTGTAVTTGTAATVVGGGSAAATIGSKVLEYAQKGKDVLNAYDQVKQGLQQGLSMDQTANQAYAQLTPQQQMTMQQTSMAPQVQPTTQMGLPSGTTSITTTEKKEENKKELPAWVLPVAGVGALAILGLVFVIGKKSS